MIKARDGTILSEIHEIVNFISNKEELFKEWNGPVIVINKATIQLGGLSSIISWIFLREQ